MTGFQDSFWCWLSATPAQEYRRGVLEKPGTPFLTTTDTGTGLGLPVCYRIAEHHGAKIEVATGLEGTTLV